LFSTLTSMVGAWAGRRVLDLYAGSGAVGLEALSRGADHCLLVESDPRALRILRANIETVGLPGAASHGGRVERLVSGAPPGPAYDVVFLDPPYDLGADTLGEVLTLLVEQGWLAARAVVALERASRDARSSATTARAASQPCSTNRVSTSPSVSAPRSYGGSRNTTSYAGPGGAPDTSRSTRPPWDAAPGSPTVSMFARRMRRARGSDSTRRQWSAPRLSASSPTAPDPA